MLQGVVEIWRQLRAHAGHACCVEFARDPKDWALDLLAQVTGFIGKACVGTNTVQFQDGSVLWLALRPADDYKEFTPEDPPGSPVAWRPGRPGAKSPIGIGHRMREIAQVL